MLAEHGATITDAKGDWVWTSNKEDNPNPYPVPWADLLSATFAVDSDYLYIRLTVAGVYPSSKAELPWYGEDQVNKSNIDINLDTDNNENTGCLPDKGAEVFIGVIMMANPGSEWGEGYDFWYEPTGVEFPERRRYIHTENRDLVVAAWGGAGFDYRIVVLPAKLFGLHPGQTIAVIGWDECASLKYAGCHATLDVLGQGDKDNRVVIQLPE
jgi:hypothetical protein